MRIMEGQAKVATRANGVNGGVIAVRAVPVRSGGTIGHVAVMASGHPVRLRPEVRVRNGVTGASAAKVRAETSTDRHRLPRHCRKCRRLSFQTTKAWTRLRGKSK